MGRKKLTNKEITEAIIGLQNNDNILHRFIQEKDVENKQYLSLYLEYRKETFNEEVEGFHDFVKAKVEKFEKQQSKEKDKK